jgi:8-oxo-dGTP diphosphatase
MAKEYCYEYPRPAVSADCVLFGFDGRDLFTLLIERGQKPFMGKWAFPGGFLDPLETTRECAYRELREETGLDGLHLEQLGAYSGVDRDPRGRVITVSWFALVKMEKLSAVAGDDAARAEWFRVRDMPPLAFDHDLVLRTALGRLKAELIPGNIPGRVKEEFSGHELEKLLSVVNDLDFEPYLPE